MQKFSKPYISIFGKILKVSLKFTQPFVCEIFQLCSILFLMEINIGHCLNTYISVLFLYIKKRFLDKIVPTAQSYSEQLIHLTGRKENNFSRHNKLTCDNKEVLSQVL